MAIPRQLQIKTGVVKRLFKEYQGYQKEQQRQQERIDKLVASQADEHDIRKQREVLQETVVMLPDCRQRLEKAFMELSQLMNTKDPQWEGTAELETAQQVLEECNPEKL